MKRSIQNKKKEAKHAKLANENINFSKLPVKFIILNEKQIYQTKSKYLRFTLMDVKFDFEKGCNLFPYCRSKSLETKDIKMLTYSTETPLICITLKRKPYSKIFPNIENINLFQSSIWFCIDKIDIDGYKHECKQLSKCYNGVFFVKEISSTLYSSFKAAVFNSTSRPDNGEEFVSDWSCFIEVRPSSVEAGKFVYSPSSIHNVEVTQADLLCLENGRCLNDSIINFYLAYLYHELLSDCQRDRSHFFNLFFHTKLVGTESQQQVDTADSRHARVAKWTKNIDLFEKDFLVVPVIEDTHWFAVVVCFPWMAGLVDYGSRGLDDKQPFRAQQLARVKSTPAGNPMPCVLVFDSFAGVSRTPKVNLLREYLAVEWRLRRAARDGPLAFDRHTCRGYGPKVPQQSNLSDCGLYMLHYLELFFKQPLDDFSLKFFERDLLQWFDESDIKKKRNAIKGVIQKKSNLIVTFDASYVDPSL